MDLMQLFAGRRTYRRFYQKPVPQDVIDDIIEAVRLSSSSSNRQAVSLLIIRKPEDVAKVNQLVKWASFLPPEQGTPKPSEQPTLFLAILQDTEAAGNLTAVDIGIALANMTLAAWAKGVGSCIMGAINRPKLTALFHLPEHTVLHTMLALGYPSHTSHVVPIENGNTRYYLDADHNYCVPKRSPDEIAQYL